MLLVGDALLDRAHRALDVPVTHMLGARLSDPERPWAGAEFTVSHAASNGAGSAHASMVAAGLELAGYLALLPQLDSDEHALTHSITVALAAAAAVGDTVAFAGSVDRRTRRLAFVAVTAQVGETFIARAQLVKSVVAATSLQ